MLSVPSATISALSALVWLSLRSMLLPSSVRWPEARLVPVAVRSSLAFIVSALLPSLRLPLVFRPAASVPLLSTLNALMLRFSADAMVPVLVNASVLSEASPPA